MSAVSGHPTRFFGDSGFRPVEHLDVGIPVDCTIDLGRVIRFDSCGRSRIKEVSPLAVACNNGDFVRIVEGKVCINENEYVGYSFG